MWEWDLSWDAENGLNACTDPQIEGLRYMHIPSLKAPLTPPLPRKCIKQQIAFPHLTTYRLNT